MENYTAETLWNLIKQHEGEEFFTFKGLPFTYTIRGNELFVDRKDKSITLATIMLSYENAIKIIETGNIVTGPKKLGTFGASYIFPVFKKIGVLP